MHVKPYNCQIKETDISHLEMANDLIEIPIDKLINKKIPTPLNYLEPQKPY